MKTIRFLFFLSLAGALSCKKGNDSAQEPSQTASKAQDFSLESYLTLPLTFPPSDWVKFTKDSVPLAGVFNLIGDNNGPYKYSFEINVPNEKLTSRGTKLKLHVNESTVTIDKSSVVWGQDVIKTVEYCKNHRPIIKPRDCIRSNYSRFLYEYDTYTLDMYDLVDPDDAWIGLQLTFANDVADTQRIKLMIGDAGEDGQDMIVKEGQILGYGCRASTPWPGCPSVKQK